ncbi:D-glycero-beta-D-manno-heptose 1-phosphate adenylyltransferase [Thermodesulfobacteriota bacterium]
MTVANEKIDGYNYIDKIKEKEALRDILIDLKQRGKTVSFTNGCFDIIHAGHVQYLNKAKAEADVLVVAVNSDESIRQIKGDKRPLVPERERAEVLSALFCVDYVVIFNETDPFDIISFLSPDILVKGADWGLDDIIGRDIVEERGGKVIRVELSEGLSTSNIIETILERYK